MDKTKPKWNDYIYNEATKEMEHSPQENETEFVVTIPNAFEKVIYIVTSLAGIESVWDDPDEALKAYEELTEPGIIAVRPLNSKVDSEFVKKAREVIVNRAVESSIRTERI